MLNPLVVFVNKDSWTPRLTLPAGWTCDGRHVTGLNGIQDQVLCLLLLDDDRLVPNCRHSNRDPSQPVPVVLHANSTRHRKEHLPGINHDVLREWGRPVVQATFSHRPEHPDPVRVQIQAVLDDHALAPGFARKYHIEHELDVLDALAFVCVCALLDVDTADAGDWVAVLNQIPGGEAKAELGAPEGADWNSRLEAVRKRADMLVSGTSPVPAG
jgi:hypothetical protein